MEDVYVCNGEGTWKGGAAGWVERSETRLTDYGTEIPSSNHVIRRKPAHVLRIPRLDLQRGVGNPEPVLQLVADFVQKMVVKPRAGAHQMRRHGGFGRAHR